MDTIQQIRTTVERANSRSEAAALLVSEMGMTESEAEMVLTTPFTAELRAAMYPEWFGNGGLFA